MYNTTHIGLKSVKATPMSRGDYNKYRGWQLPSDERYDDEGYLVEYEPRPGEESNVQGHKGYVSWTPKQVFNDAYHSVDGNLPFGLALELAKQGFVIARRGWNAAGSKVYIQYTHKDADITLSCLYLQYPFTPINDKIRLPSNSRTVNWVPSHVDMLSSDWYVVEEDTEEDLTDTV
jgi:hypothetical protein